MKIKVVLLFACLSVSLWSFAVSSSEIRKHRVLISTDIGGTDADDNQSMTHLMMYSDMFDIEGIISTPSFGSGSKEEILRMIDIYEHDYPVLSVEYRGLLTPDSLRMLCYQGAKDAAPINGYSVPTDGSKKIVECARRDDSRPLYILVWGALEDVAQALHDAPDIESKVRIYWIGGPNKKWGVNAYAYIADNFPNIWMIENNASYRGFISNNNVDDHFNRRYYDEVISGAGHLGADFKAYYDGNIKMGDSPSLFYIMNGDPADPEGESWGGSFEKMSFSPRFIFRGMTTVNDTVAPYSVVEFRLQGPDGVVPVGTECFTLRIDAQSWNGVYVGDGEYMIRYSPKAPATLSYKIISDIKELDGLNGEITVGKLWPGSTPRYSYRVGSNWWTDCGNLSLFKGKWQGFKTIEKWRDEVLSDWEQRWKCLKR